MHDGASVRATDCGVDMLLSYDKLRGPLRHDDVRTRVTTRFEQPSADDAGDALSALSGLSAYADRAVEYAHHVLAIEAAAAWLGPALVK